MNESLSSQIEGLMPLLAAFDVAASNGHVTRAAEQLAVPQSSLSRRLKNVEKIVGLPLFRPSGRRLVLTSQGRDLFDRTHYLIAALDEAVQAVRDNADPDSGLVRFGFPLSLGPISIPALLADFHVIAPKVRLHIVQAHGDALVGQMRDSRLDLAVMIPAPSDIGATVLGYQRISFYVAHDHRLSTARNVQVADLSEETFVASPKTFHLRQVLDLWCSDAGFTPRVPFEIAEFDTLRGLVARGLGVALLPEDEIGGSELTRVDIAEPRSRSIALACAERANPAVLKLRDHIVAGAASFVDDIAPA